MATMTEILARSHREVGYVLFLEGCPFAFTNRPELAGSGPDSWITDFYGARTIYEGLSFPDSLTRSTSLETGMLESTDGATFTIQDFDNQIIEYVRYIEDPDTLAQRLTPLDTPAPALLLDEGGNSVNIWGRWVNGEAIGAAGQRNRFQLFPTDPMPGYDHAAVVGETQTLAPSAVYDAPTALDGRKCALYRIYRDEATGNWPGWATHYLSDQSLIWHGTITSVSAEAKTWKFACDGQSSWLRKQLNVNRPTEWQYATPTLQNQVDSLFAIEMRYFNGTTVLNGASSYWDPVNDYIAPGTSAENLLALLNSRLQALAGTAGPDITYNAYYKAKAILNQAGSRAHLRAKIDDNVDSMAAMFTLTMAEEYWALLGFDTKAQSKAALDDELHIFFYPQGGGIAAGQFQQKPVPAGYETQVTALISTIPLGFLNPTEAGSKADNNGEWRNFPAKSLLGGASLNKVDYYLQEIVLAIGQGPYIEGQTKRATYWHVFSEAPGTPAADTTGYFALRGTYTPQGGEPVTRHEIIKAGWYNDDNRIGQDNNGRPILCLEEYLDPRWFGMKRYGGFPWAVNDLEIRPITVIGYNDNFGDRADLLLLQTMLSTGTSTWSGYELNDSDVRALGFNAHVDAIYGGPGNDSEIADLGLGIYRLLIDWGSFRETAQQLPDGGENSPLNRCKYAFSGPFDSQELIARILAPRGWAMGFVNGQYRLFSRPQLLNFQDADLTLGPDDFVEDNLGTVVIEKVDLTPLTPKDRFSVTYGEPLISEAAPDTEIDPQVIQAQDPGARTRHSNSEQDIDGFGLVPYTLWNGGNQVSAWGAAWSKLWGRTMATYYGAPYLMVSKLRVQFSKARYLGPGSVVRFEGSFGPSREGVYALQNKVGRVIRITDNLNTLTSDVDILIQPGESTSLRRFAPIAQVVDMVSTVEERHDPDARKLYCYKNAFRHEGDATLHDVTWFEEPAWLGIGGSALVYGWQWDGRRWQQTFGFEVEGASPSDDSITYVAGSFTGTFHEAMPTYLLLAPYDDQAPGNWTRSIFSVVTGSDFKFGMGPTKGFKLINQ